MTKSPFAVAEGVAWVNGAPVPADRVVHLTEAEASFDLGHDRISPLAPADEQLSDPGPSRPRRRAPAADADG